MVICTIMRMLEGISLPDTAIRQGWRTRLPAVSAMHITSVTCREEVTARAEQQPSICKAMGLFLKIGLVSVSLAESTIRPPRISDFQEWREAVLAQPELHEVRNTTSGQGGAGHTVDLVFGAGAAGNRAFTHGYLTQPSL